MSSSQRLTYIDNLRILLSSLVILFHLATAYGGVGAWTYVEGQAEFPGGYFLTLYNATCQSFFMGLFFFISAYFTPGALERKGYARFLLDRLVRFGIPILLYYFLLEPLTRFFACSWKPVHPPLSELILSGSGWSVGVMWFVVALGLFSLLCTLAHGLVPALRRARKEKPVVLRDRHLIALMLCLCLVTFLVRLAYPIGRTLPLVGFNVAHFSQYIALFSLGLLAAKRNVGQSITLAQSKRWGVVAVLMVAFVFPALFVAGGALSGEVTPFMGGATWQSFAFSSWEQCTGIAIMAMLLGFAREKWNYAGRLGKKLAACAYPVYVFHPPILVGFSVMCRGWSVGLFTKFVVLAVILVPICFAFAACIRAIPFAKRIF